MTEAADDAAFQVHVNRVLMENLQKHASLREIQLTLVAAEESKPRPCVDARPFSPKPAIQAELDYHKHISSALMENLQKHTSLREIQRIVVAAEAPGDRRSCNYASPKKKAKTELTYYEHSTNGHFGVDEEVAAAFTAGIVLPREKESSGEENSSEEGRSTEGSSSSSSSSSSSAESGSDVETDIEEDRLLM
jgi:hypothetical protein